MSHCFTRDSSRDHSTFNRKSHSLLQGCDGSSPWAREGQGVCCLQEMSMQGVEEGSELFSLESDGWEEQRTGVSTCPALIPARQGTARPARSSSGCGECLEVETHSLRELKWDQKSKHTCLHLCPRSLISAHSHLQAASL